MRRAFPHVLLFVFTIALSVLAWPEAAVAFNSSKMNRIRYISVFFLVAVSAFVLAILSTIVFAVLKKKNVSVPYKRWALAILWTTFLISTGLGVAMMSMP